MKLWNIVSLSTFLVLVLCLQVENMMSLHILSKFMKSKPFNTFRHHFIGDRSKSQHHLSREGIHRLYLSRQMSMTAQDKKQIVFLGTPECAAKSLQLLIDESKKPSSIFEISAVVSQPAAAAGRNRKLTKSPVQILAENNNITLFTPVKANETDFLSSLQEMKPDLCVTAAYGNFLPQVFLDIPKFGTLNIHPSLLPKYRGAAPVQRCLENGDAKTGVSVVVTVLKMDAGPIIQQLEHSLNGNEKCQEVLNDMFIKGTEALAQCLPSVFDRSVNLRPQDNLLATKARKLSSSESQLDFSSMNALAIHNKVRGFSMWPGTWSQLVVGPNEEKMKVKIITTQVLDARTQPGNRKKEIEIVKAGKTDMLKVVCGDGSTLAITELQPEGKKVMFIRDFVNGLRGSKVIYWESPIVDIDDRKPS
jgi:methionyl-tRNA formyltransferase